MVTRRLTTDAAAIAADVAASAVGRRPAEVRRFATGSQHYVFEATFDDRLSLVVRIAAEHSRSAMLGALKLSQLLRPRGVPLPKIIADGSSDTFPYLVLERLPGSDLGELIGGLSDQCLATIAAKVAAAQTIAAATVQGKRYGYGVDPRDSPHDRWSRVLLDNLARSRRRIVVARLFDEGVVGAVAEKVSAVCAELDTLPPIAFLHDTTTKNVIVTAAGDLSGIVDVDDLCFGDPRYVVALTLASLRVSGHPTHYVDAWMSAANHCNDRVFGLYVALFLVDFMSEHGQEFNGNVTPSSFEARERLLGAFREQLRLV